MSSNLSEYELARLENIKKNEEFLKSLGLYKDPAEVAKQEAAEERRKKTKKEKKRIPKHNADIVPVVRRSSRNSNSESAIKDESLVSLSDIEDGENTTRVNRKYAPMEDAEMFFKIKAEYGDEDEDAETVRITPDELRTYILSANEKHSDMISDAAITLCAYRCSYMSIAALRNRINAINRGAGKKSQEKLLVVTYAMRAMGLIKLSELAAQYLKHKTGIEVSWCDTPTGNGTSGDAPVEPVAIKEEAASGDVGEGEQQHRPNLVHNKKNNKRERRLKLELTDVNAVQTEGATAAAVKVEEGVGVENASDVANNFTDNATSRSNMVIKEEPTDGTDMKSPTRKSPRRSSRSGGIIS